MMYVKNRLSFNKRMSAIQRAIDAISWQQGVRFAEGSKYYALRNAQERLISWGNQNPVIKTPTSKPSNGWDVIVYCECGTVRRDSVLFYEIGKAILELAQEKDEKEFGDITNIFIQ